MPFLKSAEANSPARQTEDGGAVSPIPRPQKKKRYYERFAQQELRGWSPVITGRVVVLYFLASTAVCLALGIPILISSLNVKVYYVRYDNAGPMGALGVEQRAQLLYEQDGQGVPATVQINVTSHMEAPVYIYYKLHSYFQNHKRYVRSRDDSQNGGNGGDPAGECEPQQYIGGSRNASLPNDGAITPCGLIAWSFFNDTFAVGIQKPGEATTQPVTVDDNNIAWSYDKNHLYGAVEPVNYNVFVPLRGGNTSTAVLNANQHWMVWMRPAASPSFRKLWGVINTDIPAGSVLTIDIQNRYNTYEFRGEKEFVLSTTSWIGGRNDFLGIVYIVIAGISFLFSIGFTVFHYGGFCGFKRRKFGDVSQLSWNKKPS